MQAIYRVKSKISVADDNYSYDNQALDIGEKFSRYYSLFAEDMDSVMWKAMREKSTIDVGVDLHKNLKSDEAGTYEDIFINEPIIGMLTLVRRFGEKNFQYTEPTPKITWLLEYTTEKILGYNCQKATCTFRGRRWTAWFAPEIPVSMGPYKFGGLPGLILKITDSNHIYEFTAIGITRPQNSSIYKYNIPTVKSSRKEVGKLLDMRWQDPAGLTFATSPEVEAIMHNGKMVKSGDVQEPKLFVVELE